jgi:hypothetical protein
MTVSMPTPRKIRHRLTERDQKILQLLALHGCVTAIRIKRQFWTEKENLRSHYRRLGILRREALIESVMGDGTMTIGYRLT